MSLRGWLFAGGLVAATSAVVVAQDAPESLLPPGFDQPAPTPSPTPRPSARPAPAPGGGNASVPVIQPLPGRPSALAATGPAQPGVATELDPEALEALIEAQRPKADIPPQQARSLDRVGLLAQDEGGFAPDDTRVLNGEYVRAVLEGTKRSLVSRWGSILVRRVLASRLTTPAGMNGADWAALRARLLLRMGEADTARALVQQVDSGAFTPGLEDAALDAYVATADFLGACPIVAITAARRQEAGWQVVRQICRSFEGEGTGALSELERLRQRGVGGGFTNVDLLLAQKYAGSALESRKAVRIEWSQVDDMTPWRLGLARAVGLVPPKNLLDSAAHRYDAWTAVAPMVPLAERAAAADLAAARGVLSSAAMVDLYSQIYGDEEVEGEWKGRAEQLRQAYVAAEPSARLSAIKSLWGNEGDYGRRVLTAYAAARLPVGEGSGGDADALIVSMLAAGLDRNAARWNGAVDEGSQGWALLALASPGNAQVTGGAVESFRDDDPSDGDRRSRFLLAGLYGLGRIPRAAATTVAGTLGVNLGRETKWTRAIRAASESGNPALTVLLAGAGMQGDGWDKMTALHLYHIVAALRRVGLEPEARMIAAEAVARG